MQRQHFIDVSKVIGVWVAWFWSINWNALGGFLSCIATVLVILNLLGALKPLQAWFGRQFGHLKALVHKGA